MLEHFGHKQHAVVLDLKSKVIALKQDVLRLMNLALAGTACSQLLSIFKFAFGYPKSKESRERGKQLEELEHKFEPDNESPAEEDMVSKSQDTLDAAAQFADADKPKPKCRKFGMCHDNLKDLVPIHKATPIMPSTTVKLSETGVSCKM